jgi:hypothetical protein
MYGDMGDYHSVIDERGQFQAAPTLAVALASDVQPDRFRTTDVRASALKA